jgi:hypothetical protein
MYLLLPLLYYRRTVTMRRGESDFNHPQPSRAQTISARRTFRLIMYESDASLDAYIVREVGRSFLYQSDHDSWTCVFSVWLQHGDRGIDWSGLLDMIYLWSWQPFCWWIPAGQISIAIFTSMYSTRGWIVTAHLACLTSTCTWQIFYIKTISACTCYVNPLNLNHCFLLLILSLIWAVHC